MLSPLQSFRVSDLLSNMLVLQLMAPSKNMMFALDSDAEQHITATLSMQTNAAVAGMQPRLAASCWAAGLFCQAASTPIASKAAAAADCATSSRSPTTISTNSSSMAADPGSNDASGTSASCSRSTGRMRRTCEGVRGGHGPSLYHLAAELGGCFHGPADLTLPWLQLLARYHALTAALECQHEAVLPHVKRSEESPSKPSTAAVAMPTEHSADPALDPRIEPQGSIASMAATLQSFGMPLPKYLSQLSESVQRQYLGCQNVPVLGSPFVTPFTPSLQAHWSCSGSQEGHAQLHQQQQHGYHPQGEQPRQQPVQGSTCGTEQVPERGRIQQEQALLVSDKGGARQLPVAVGDLERCCYWLHAERLVQVQPHDWQQHLGQELMQHRTPTHSTSSSSTCAAVSSSTAQQVLVLADLACDWCAGPLPNNREAAAQQMPPTAAASSSSSSSSSNNRSTKQKEGCSTSPKARSDSSSSCAGLNSTPMSSGKVGCVWCGMAQYCSQGCADAAKQVHSTNCW